MLNKEKDSKGWEKAFSIGSLFLFLFDFNSISMRPISQLCWAHWQNCRSFPIPLGMPESYNYSILFSIIFGVIVVGFYGVFKNKEKIYIPALWFLASFKFFYNFIWIFSGNHNFELFHLVPTFAFLLNRRDRILGAQLSWVVCYFMAAFVKLDEGWILGTYFSSLQLGLPFLPDFSIPFVTQMTIVFEMFLSWGLLTQKYRRLSLVTWTIFHIYSVILVGFYYPTRCMIFLFLLFFFERKATVSLKKINPSALVLCFFLLIIQLLPLAYRNEDLRVSSRFEGYGFEMFPANYQCISNFVHFSAAKITPYIQESNSARNRCSPRGFLEKYRLDCEKLKLDKITWKLSQSVNGGPFYEIVNVPDACSLKYSLFGKNDWIDTGSNKITGYPKKNSIVQGKSSPGQSIESRSPVIKQSAVQKFIKEYYTAFYLSYLLLWVSILLFVVYRAVYPKVSKTDANT